jgi:hypothetical protein
MDTLGTVNNDTMSMGVQKFCDQVLVNGRQAYCYILLNARLIKYSSNDAVLYYLTQSFEV